MPMLVGYELGVLALGSRMARNGADVWLRSWLDWLGFGQYFLLPLLTCSLLLAWHHTRREAWRLEWYVLGGMLCESALLGLGLLLMAQCQHAWMASVTHPSCATSLVSDVIAARVVAYCGAGIYEELLFRLALMPAFILMFRWLFKNTRTSGFAAILVTSALFAAAHYRVDIDLGSFRITLPYGDAFAWSSFSFRFLAGTFFATLFVTRGFGIAAGAHALYDIFAILL
jgi:membrane protease YdiL (CAAX protease family)